MKPREGLAWVIVVLLAEGIVTGLLASRQTSQDARMAIIKAHPEATVCYVDSMAYGWPYVCFDKDGKLTSIDD